MFSYLSSRRPGRLILLATFALAVPAYAQNITGSMTGRVTDQQGASIPNAIVTVTEPAKHVTAAQKTTAGGDFSVAGSASRRLLGHRRGHRLQETFAHRHHAQRQ